MSEMVIYDAQLQQRLKREAIELDACNEGINSWGEPTMQDLCEKFHKYQDFCIDKNWPSIDDFESVPINMLLEHGIAHRGKHTMTSPNHIVVLGDADVTIAVPDFGVYRVYARHSSKVHLKLGAHSHVYISMLDKCEVDVMCKRHDSRLACSHFGGKIKTPMYFDKINEKIGG